MKKWYTIDIVKGFLIFLVFIGHIIPGSTGNVLSRYLIYSFHMPLFMGISGFLLNTSVFDRNFSYLLKKYFYRILLPWSIAVVVYAMYMHRTSFSVSLILNSFLYPYYHLWFIVAYFTYIVITCIVWKILKDKPNKLLYIFIFSLVLGVMEKFDIISALSFNHNTEIISEFISQNLRFHNYPFFILGMYLRKYIADTKKQNQKISGFVILSFIISAVLTFFSFKGFGFNINEFLRDFNFFIYNGLLLFIVINLCILSDMRCRVLEFIGKNSLPIYLYHVIFYQIFESVFILFGIGHNLVKFISFIPLCMCVFIATKISFINKYIFGSSEKA